MLPVYILLISALGIVLNVFVLMVFCLHKKACTVAEIYLGNMAAADLILVSCLPFWAMNAANKFDWTFANFVCPLLTLSINMNAYCSIYFLVLISIDRYLALVHPLSHGGMRRPKYAKLACVLVWCFGLLLGVPTFVYREVRYFPHLKSHICFFNYPNVTVRLLIEWMLMTFGVIIPISIISYCTFKIIKALNNRLIEGFNGQKMEQKATTLVLAVLLVFMICWVPLHLVKFLQTLRDASVLRGCTIISIFKTCSLIFMALAFTNSVLNPILYVLIGKNFRKKVRELFQQYSRNRRATLINTSVRSHLFRSVKTENAAS